MADGTWRLGCSMFDQESISEWISNFFLVLSSIFIFIFYIWNPLFWSGVHCALCTIQLQLLTSTTFHSNTKFMLRSTISPFDDTDKNCENRTELPSSITGKWEIIGKKVSCSLFATITASIRCSVSSHSHQVDNNLFSRHSAFGIHFQFSFCPILKPIINNHLSIRGKKANPIIEW